MISSIKKHQQGVCPHINHKLPHAENKQIARFILSDPPAIQYKEMESEVREKVICVHLTEKYQIISFEVVSIGMQTYAIADPVEILRGAVLVQAAKIIVPAWVTRAIRSRYKRSKESEGKGRRVEYRSSRCHRHRRRRLCQPRRTRADINLNP